jgi:2,3-bisphosphoglycerate-dependent phosphoglycerate mutase
MARVVAQAPTFYLVRHAQAEGQAPEAGLTETGRADAAALVSILTDLGVDRIVSSPYRRALATVEPFARQRGFSITEDIRLIEAPLSSNELADWREKLEQSFEDLDLCFEGGESGNVATRRAVAALSHTLSGAAGSRPVIVTHGRLMTLLLKHFRGDVGFSHWERLSTPDLFQVKLSGHGGCEFTRLWKNDPAA